MTQTRKLWLFIEMYINRSTRCCPSTSPTDINNYHRIPAYHPTKTNMEPQKRIENELWRIFFFGSMLRSMGHMVATATQRGAGRFVVESVQIRLTKSINELVFVEFGAWLLVLMLENGRFFSFQKPNVTTLISFNCWSPIENNNNVLPVTSGMRTFLIFTRTIQVPRA